ncbi:MAG: gliding motility-associated C-terminal domain-containing protein, partial [Bacteroidota bacterium]
PDEIAAPTDTTTAANLAPGTYVIGVTDAKGCQDTLEHTIIEPSPIMATFPTPEEPQCFGFSTFIQVNDGDVSGGQGVPYKFSVDQGSEKELGESQMVLAGEYVVNIFDKSGCSVSETIRIEQPDDINIILEDVIDVSLGETITLAPRIESILAIENYTWSSADTVIVGEERPSLRPLRDETYTFLVEDSNGCFKDASVSIEVDKPYAVFRPNAFSPNFDGRNDIFRIFTGIDVKAIPSMQIFDRWGELVYSQKDVEPLSEGTTGWDGTFKGEPATPGVYVYTIEVVFLNDERRTYRGSVMLMQ